MAISDMKGTVSTTGMMNQPVKMPEGNVNPQLPQSKPETQTAQAPVQNTESSINNLINERVQTLTDEENAAIDAALSPSVKSALGKILPEAKPLMDQFGSNEPNVIIPLSVAKRYATSKYGGETESDALTNFMTDMMSPEINAAGNNQMETQQTNVPPGNEPQGLMTSPQNMETV
jgi:hypothetical protein